MAGKKYAEVSTYESKLKKVMERLGATEYDYGWTRKNAYVRFKYKGTWYQFDHSTEKSGLTYGTDVFSQIVLALEDLARMVERGIYELGTWITGMKYLPPVFEMPECFKLLGFSGTELPTADMVKTRYYNMAKELHPDAGGNEQDFIELQDAVKKCLDYLEDKANER